ncbi:MAG TPA: CDF family Co(II)/Ni(II) efflux transporter DmeF, partial [Allosphingosinicella sp.]
MHSHSAGPWHHDHLFLGENAQGHERRTWLVVGVTIAAMVAEVGAGLAFGSMALLADGLHMATHAGALTLAGAAYAYARLNAEDPRFAFGTGKVGDLAAFASAVVLAMVALLIGWESLERMTAPAKIDYPEAMAVGAAGLLVNLVSAWLLHPSEQSHDPGASDHRHDHNLRGAYLHVLADALTSVLAIAALLAGSFYGWTWLDPAVGLVGAIVIARWSVGLMKESG